MFRAYDASSARWLNRDPIGEAGGLNLYGYAGGDPVNRTDALGLAWYNWPDDLGNWAQCQHAAFSRTTLSKSGDGINWFLVGYINTVSQMAAGILSYPQALSHLGEGTGAFSVNPSWENAPALLMDISLTADILALGAAPLSAAKKCQLAAAETTGAENALLAVRLNNQLAADEIAAGHAFDKHVVEGGEFPGILSRDQFSTHIEDIINNPSDIRALSNGRTAYWDEASQTVVIRNPSAIDGGTAFKPKQGKTYFNNLK